MNKEEITKIANEVADTFLRIFMGDRD